MKGIILCGGEGTRLRPLTEVVNKHLIRIVDKPMAEYPLCKMIECGIKEFLIVTGGSNFAGVVKYFGSGSKWNVRITYAIQDQAGGIAQALYLAKDFTGDDQILVVLGDNFWNGDIRPLLKNKTKECMLFSHQVEDPQHYGVFQYGVGPGGEKVEITDILEKPKNPPSKSAATGIYCYGPEVFEIIEDIKPSERGELEITDVNKFYIKAHTAEVVELPGEWYDCGQFDSLLKVEKELLHDRSV